MFDSNDWKTRRRGAEDYDKFITRTMNKLYQNNVKIDKKEKKPNDNKGPKEIKKHKYPRSTTRKIRSVEPKDMNASFADLLLSMAYGDGTGTPGVIDSVGTKRAS